MIEDVAYRVTMQVRHPSVVRFGYMLETDTFKRADAFLKNWVELGKGGLAFSAPSRMGKTYAIRKLYGSLKAAFSHIACVSITAETESRTDRFSRTYSELLQQLKKDDPTRLRSKNCDVFAGHLMSLCRDSDALYCVVFLDEAQKFNEQQWNALYIALNRLESNGVGMLVYSFGNEELGNRGKLLVESGNQGIGGRFFVRMMSFEGVRTKDELRTLLKQYDEALHFPDPHWPYTRYFARAKYDHDNWRLEFESDAYWSALCEYAGVHEGGPRRSGFCMQWITDPIHFVLKDCLTSEAKGKRNESVAWVQAIEQTCPHQIY